MKTKYQNSVCKRGWLHKWVTTSQDSKGIVERCERCGKKMMFSSKMPNHIFLSYHIRSVLRADDALFSREYPNIQI